MPVNEFYSNDLTATEHFRLPVGISAAPRYLGELRRVTDVDPAAYICTNIVLPTWRRLLTDADLLLLPTLTSSNGITKIGNDFRLGGTLTGNTSITGAFDINFNLVNFKCTASGNVALEGTSSGSNLLLKNNGITLYAKTLTDTDTTLTRSSYLNILPTISANRILTFPTPTDINEVPIFEIYNKNTSGFNWSVAGAGIKNYDGTLITTLNNGEFYSFRWIVDSWIRVDKILPIYSGTLPISVIGNTISISTADSTTSGILTSVDWNTFSNKVSTVRAISTINSITGGGDLSANRTLQLVNDQTSPVANSYYGTNSIGTKGWYNLPSGGTGSVTSVSVASTDLSVLGSPITTSGTITLNVNNNAISFAKMQDISTATLIGRYSTGTGDPQTISLGTGLSLDGLGVLSVVSQGTVSSVGLTMPSAFSVTGSPITSSGIISVTATGTTSQYIRGDGTLATFPALGEVNTASNLGTVGGRLFSSKVGSDLRFRRIIGAGGTTVTENVDDVTVTTPQQLSLTASGAATISGIYPNINIDVLPSGTGTVTSVGLTVPTGLSVSPSAITTSGTFAITTSLSGLLYGTGAGFATSVVSAPLIFSSGTLSITQATTSTNGYLTSTDWNTFNAKVPTVRTITGVASVSGGGDLSTNRSFSLVNDLAIPGNNKLYGTNSLGVKGWYDQPSGSASYTGTLPIQISGSVISILTASSLQTGALSQADWNVFNGKVSPSRSVNTVGSLTGGGDLSANRTLQLVGDVNSPGNFKYYGTNGTGTKTWIDFYTVSRSSISVSGAPFGYNPATGIISMNQASSALAGYLSATDWSTFNNKVATSRAINTTNSIIGGGDLSTNRTLQLVNDVATPGTYEYYGTNSTGVKGYHPLPGVSSDIEERIDSVTLTDGGLDLGVSLFWTVPLDYMATIEVTILFTNDTDFLIGEVRREQMFTYRASTGIYSLVGTTNTYMDDKFTTFSSGVFATAPSFLGGGSALELLMYGVAGKVVKATIFSKIRRRPIVSTSA